MSLGRRTGRTTRRPAWAAMGYDENVLKALSIVFFAHLSAHISKKKSY